MESNDYNSLRQKENMESKEPNEVAESENYELGAQAQQPKASDNIRSIASLTKMVKQLSISKGPLVEQTNTIELQKKPTLTVPSKLEHIEEQEDRELEEFDKKSRSRLGDQESQERESQNKMIVIKIPPADSKKKVVILEESKPSNRANLPVSQPAPRRKSVWVKPPKKKLAKRSEGRLAGVEEPELLHKFVRNIDRRWKKASYLFMVGTFYVSLVLYNIANIYLNQSSEVVIWGNLISKLNSFSSIFLERKLFYAHLIRETAYLTNGVFPDRYAWTRSLDPNYASNPVKFADILDYLPDSRKKAIERIMNRTKELYLKVNSREDMLYADQYVSFNVSTDYKNNKTVNASIWDYLEITNLQIGLTKDFALNQVKHPNDLRVRVLMVNFANYEIINQGIFTGLGIKDTFEYVGREYFFRSFVWLLGTEGGILTEFTITILALIYMFRRFQAIHSTFESMKAPDRRERIAQLEYCRGQLRNIIADNYFGFHIPKSDYTLPADPETDGLPNKMVDTKKRKRKCFLFGLGPLVLFLTSYYIIIGAIAYISYSLIQAKGQQLVWLAEKNIGAQKLTHAYLDYWNNLSTAFMQRGAIIQFQTPRQFFDDFDGKIDVLKGTFTDLMKIESSSSTNFIPEIYEEIHRRFESPLCDKVDPALKTMCRNLHGDSGQLGLATVLSRMNKELLNVHYDLRIGRIPRLSIVAKPEFIQMEFSSLTLYFPLLTQFARDMSAMQEAYLNHDTLSALRVFIYGNWIIAGCYAFLGILVFRKVWLAFQINYFAFSLLSLNSYEKNQALKVALLSNLSKSNSRLNS